MLKRRPIPLSEADYLAQEAASPLRHEYVAGAAYAMTGGSLRHNIIAGNLFALLRAHLRGTPCRVFMSDAKLHVAQQHAYYYPDVMVACELPTLNGSELVVDAPVLVVEVTSPSSEGTDRREKLWAYRTLPSLKDYVLIAQDRAEIEIHTRLGDTAWEITSLVPGDPVVLTSVELITDFTAIYEESGLS